MKITNTECSDKVTRCRMRDRCHAMGSVCETANDGLEKEQENLTFMVYTWCQL